MKAALGKEAAPGGKVPEGSPDPHEREGRSKRGRKKEGGKKEWRDVLGRQMLCSGWESENQTGDDGVMRRRRRSEGDEGLRERR